MAATRADALSLLAPGAQVEVRDEEWLVRAVQQTAEDGLMVRVIGTSELVRDREATFFTELDEVSPLRPEDTVLVADPAPGVPSQPPVVGGADPQDAAAGGRRPTGGGEPAVAR